jgi:hypothetical protein
MHGFRIITKGMKIARKKCAKVIKKYILLSGFPRATLSSFVGETLTPSP